MCIKHVYETVLSKAWFFELVCRPWFTAMVYSEMRRWAGGCYLLVDQLPDLCHGLTLLELEVEKLLVDIAQDSTYIKPSQEPLPVYMLHT